MRRRLCEKASMGRLQELLSELTINFNRNHMMEPTHVPRHPSSFLNCVTIFYREAVRKKYGIIWEFSTNGGPPNWANLNWTLKGALTLYRCWQIYFIQGGDSGRNVCKESVLLLRRKILWLCPRSRQRDERREAARLHSVNEGQGVFKWVNHH